MVVIAGHRYGSGSARDWAAKGTALLGVRAVIAGSFERIHRSNLAALGVLPIIVDLPQDMLAQIGPRSEVSVSATLSRDSEDDRVVLEVCIDGVGHRLAARLALTHSERRQLRDGNCFENAKRRMLEGGSGR